MALIHIAHPDHREQLMEEARNRKLVYSDQVAVFGHGDLNRRSFEKSVTSASGKPVHIRPVLPTDEDMMRDLFYACSEETLYHRFFTKMRAMPHRKLKKFVNIDYVKTMALASVIHEDERQMIVAVGRYSVNKATNAAEVAFIVRDDWQGQGVGVAMFNQLLDVARKRGIVRFTADVLHDNARMLHIFHKCAPASIESTLDDGVYHLSFSIKPGD
jgi:RimJ/RimL family protein N-acetyltransferase